MIQSITLNGYDRFSLPSISKFQMDMKSPVQIIVGTNGSGKTSLLAQLSPLPPASTDFPNGGGKIIRIFHNAKQYEMVSSYGKTTEHFFYCEGVNLNQSRKETEQKALVKEHFGLTQQSFSLISGLTKFTEMSKQKRQEWLMLLSGMDFDYIMKVYRNAKDRHRDLQALAKGYAQRESDEVNRLEELRRPEEIQADLICVEEELNNASLHRNSASDVKVTDHHIDTIINGLAHDTDEVFKLLDAKMPECLSATFSVAECDSVILSWDHRVKENEGKLRTLYQKREDLNQLLDASIQEGESVLIENQRNLNDKQTTILQAMGYFTPDDVDYISSSYEEIFQRLGDAIGYYKDNREMNFSKSRRESLEQAHRDLTERKNTRSTRLVEVTHDLAHAKSSPTYDCPKCDHRFVPGFDDARVSSLQDESSRLYDEIDQIDKQIAKITLELGEFTEFQQIRSTIYEILKSNKRLQPLTDKIMETEKQGCNAFMLRSVLTDFYGHAMACSEYRSVVNDLETVSNAIKMSARVKELNDKYHGTVASDIDDEINQLINESTRLKAQIAEAKNFVSKVKQANRHRDNLRNQLERLDRALDLRVKTIRGEVVDAYVSERQRELTALTEELSRAENITSLIRTLSEFRKDAETKLEAAKKLVEVLSPTDGIIAEYLGGFLVNFVASMNDLIEEIWKYDFKILPCVTSNGEIDYRFPVLIGNRQRPRDDVSQTSAAQTDVINLAFRLIAMKLLGLENMPFFIDEPPPTMDEAHRMKMNMFIKNFLSSGQCDQIFMVSHYVSNHGIFTNADFCVLDASNIINMPTVYNRHVKMS